MVITLSRALSFGMDYQFLILSFIYLLFYRYNYLFFLHLKASRIALYSLSYFNKMRTSNGIRKSSTYLINTHSPSPPSPWPRVWCRNRIFLGGITRRVEWWKICTSLARARMYLSFSEIDDGVSRTVKPQFFLVKNWNFLEFTYVST